MSSSPRPAPTAGADGGDDDDRRDDRSGTDSEGEGDDLRPGVNDDDSSEEEEDDPEEARRIAQGFIADEDDEEEEEEEEEDSDGGKKRRKSKGKKRRRREPSSPAALSDDDLDLLAENTGRSVPSRASTSQSKPKKLVRRRHSSVSSAGSASSGDEDLPNVNDLTRIFDDMPRRRRELDEDDDMGDFIEEDEMPEGVMDAEEERRRKRKAKKREKGALGSMRAGAGGIDKAAWDDIYDVFGNGDDYDWALEGEEELMGGVVDGSQPRIEDVFEPSEILARHLTEADNLIRVRDIPERHQLYNSTLASPPAYLPTDFPTFPYTTSAARWIATRISVRTATSFAPMSAAFRSQFLAAVEKAVEFMFVEHYEVPFIWEHRRDYIIHYDGETPVELLLRNELWRVYELGMRYRALMERKAGLEKLWSKLAQRLPADGEGEGGEEDMDMDIDDEEDGGSSAAAKATKLKDPRRPYFELEVLRTGGTAEEGVEGVVDGLEWLKLKYARELREMREEQEPDKEGKGRPKSNLERFRESRLSIFVRAIGVPIEDVVSLNLGQPVPQAFQEDPAEFPDDYANEFLDGKILKDAPAVLSTAQSILVQDFVKNPTLRRNIRQLFRDKGLVTVLPTEKGLTKIDAFHPYFSFKYLKNKPIAEMSQTAQFLHILEAEKNLLVNVFITLSPEDIQRVEDQLYDSYKSNAYSDKAMAWNEYRRGVIKRALRDGLVPLGTKWVKEWLHNESEDATAAQCGAKLEAAANQSPYRPRQYEKGDSPSVLAVSHGRGEKSDAVMCVFIDEEGHVLETIKVEDLIDERSDIRKENDQRDGKVHPADGGILEFKQLISRRQPSVIVMGGFATRTHKLTKAVTAIAKSLAVETMETKGVAVDSVDYEASLADETLPVIYVPDNVARIFQHSARALKEFSTLPPTARYCVGLGRYAQSPMHEFCALGSDIVAITFDEYSQKLVPTDKILIAFERALVNIVNDVGVCINDVVSDQYQQFILPFVSGFGPRKAAQLVRDIVKTGGTVANRLEFLRKNLLGSAIFDNAIGFLEITHELDELELTGEDVESQPDPLDQTRIHPEDYEFARKMADNALELDEEDTTDDHPSKSVLKLMQDVDAEEKLNELHLDDFADNLRELRQVEKRFALKMIKDEIVDQGKDRRADFVLPDPWTVLTMLSGESESSLKAGLLVAAFVTQVRTNTVFLRLDSGVEGNIDLPYIADYPPASCAQVVKPQTTVQALILSVDPVNFLTQLSIRPMDLANNQEQLERQVIPDPRYDYDQLAADTAAQYKKKQMTVDRTKRQIDHPYFYNMNSAQAEQHLTNQQRGDVVIRPSSKGIDHLAVTWKVDDGLYQHLDVVEIDKPNPQALGRLLRVGGKYNYMDLDELIVNHVKATARMTEQLMTHDKFHGKTLDELHAWIKMQLAATPNRSCYAFGLDRKHPGYFVLAFLAKQGGTIQNWPVRVAPGSYFLGEAEVPGVHELCDAFKIQYEARMNAGGRPGGAGAGSRLGGATPMHGRPSGGRTPHLGGGTTPFRGATPRGAAAIAGNGSYVPTGATPFGAGASAYATGATQAAAYGAGAGGYYPPPGAGGFPNGPGGGLPMGMPPPTLVPTGGMGMGMGMGMSMGMGGGGPYPPPPPPPSMPPQPTGPMFNAERARMLQQQQDGGEGGGGGGRGSY